MTTMMDGAKASGRNLFFKSIQSFLTNSASAEETTSYITSTVVDSEAPDTALWELWDALFTAAAVASDANHCHPALISLLGAIRGSIPAKPTKANDSSQSKLSSYVNSDGMLEWASLPRFGAQWRDTHDILQAWRNGSANGEEDRLNSSDPGELSTGDKFFNFCAFSAALVGRGFDDVIQVVWVFFACREALEKRGPERWIEDEARSKRRALLNPEQVWALDVRVAAAWMKSAGKVLYGKDNNGIGASWSRALKKKTDYWQNEDGLNQDRWELWAERFEALSGDVGLDEGSRTAAKEAAQTAKTIMT